MLHALGVMCHFTSSELISQQLTQPPVRVETRNKQTFAHNSMVRVGNDQHLSAIDKVKRTGCWSRDWFIKARRKGGLR